MIIYLSKEELILMNSDTYEKVPNIFQTTNVIFAKQIANQQGNDLLAYFSNKLYLVKVSEKSL
jgi:hypothetical protein